MHTDQHRPDGSRFDLGATVAVLVSMLLPTLAPCLAAPGSAPTSAPMKIEQWGRFELALPGPRDGNPFLDVSLTADFTSNDTKKTVQGFCDGDGTYLVRFMPPTQGTWRFVTHSNR